MTYSKNILVNFQSKIEFGPEIDSCWNWTGGKTNSGYGIMKCFGNMTTTHKLSYELYKGIIPDGLEIDHLCNNKSCCNPDHLETVSHRENMIRMGKNKKPITHCVHGHEYTKENTYINSKNRKVCRECWNR